ncbi:MAG TPA: TonB-dependent receptor [Gemmatimonadales bacterium]|nr:TonB-dependent receptor [Gemmatimonadales bacterium]
MREHAFDLPFAAAVLALLAPAALHGQGTPASNDSSKVTELAPIEVTAARAAQSPPPPVETVQVSAEQIQRTPATDAYDLVRRASGIEVHQQGQGPGFASDAVIRGFTSDHSSDVLLVLDGVPINLPIHGHVEGYADWSVLSPAAVTGIRVIHGPASPFYGDFAFGGVVEATTGMDAEGTIGAVEGSSFGDAGGWVRTGRRRVDAGYAVALDGTRQEGWRDNSSYLLGNGSLAGWRQLGKGRLDGGVLLYGSNWNSPGFVSVERYNDGDLEAATDPTDGGDAGRLVAHGHYTQPMGANTTLDANLWGQGVRSKVYLNIPEDDQVAQTEEEDRRVAFGGQAMLAHQVGGGELDVGVSGRADWTEYDLYNTIARQRAGQEQGDDGDYQNGALFARWRGLIGTRIVYDVGGRLDLVRYSSLDLLDPTAVRQSETRTMASPKLGARYLLSSRVALLGNLSRGFRGAIGVIGDPTRPPVTAWSKELGTSYDDSRLHAQVALFRIDVADERILDPVTREVSDAGQSVRQGVSLDLTWTAVPRLRLLFEGTYNDAKITGIEQSGAVTVSDELAAAVAPVPIVPNLHDVPLTPGSKVPGVASWLGRTGVEADLLASVTSRALVRFSGPYTPIGEPGVRTQEYAVLDLGASIRLGQSGTTLDLDLLNAFDTRYPELRASGYLNPGAPRSLRAAMRFGGV